MPNLMTIPSLTIASGAILDEKEPALLTLATTEPLEAKQHEQKTTQITAATQFPEIVFYEHADFGGASVRTNLNWLYVGDSWNDLISSIIVVSGTWRFYADANYRGFSRDLGPGYYRWVEDVGISNDSISSFQVIAW